MRLTPVRLVRVLVAVVGVECAVALAARSVSAWHLFNGDARPVDYLATLGLVWVIVLAMAALVVSRRVRQLDEQLTTQGQHLALHEAPRQRLAAIVHRTERLIAEPEQFQVALQPILDLASGRWVTAEALARFPDNARPEVWFNDAHEAGVGTALEHLAAERAMATLQHLPPEVDLSINASPSLILDPVFGELLERAGRNCERVVVEITEHASVTAYEDIRAALLPYRERGVKLAVDDTGAGYSSFAHVLRLRPDVIKLDRSLLADIDHDAARRAFVTAIVLMALELGARVTAEGVESAAELETLTNLGVDSVQGFLLARPSTDPAVWASWATRDWLTHTGALAGTNRAQSHDVTYR